MDSQQSRLTIRFVTGVDSEGENTVTTKSFNNVVGNASDSVLIEIVHALVSLQIHPLDGAIRNNSYTLI